MSRELYRVISHNPTLKLSQFCPNIKKFLVSFVFNANFFYNLFEKTLIMPLKRIPLFGPEAFSGGLMS